MRTNYILPFRNQKYETFFFRNNFYKEALPRANPPTLVVCINIYTYININTHIRIYTRLITPFPRAASAVSSAVCTRALLISSKYETSKTIVPSIIPLPFRPLHQPAGEKSRGIFKFRRSPSFCLPSLLRYTSFTLLLDLCQCLGKSEWRAIITKIFFRVKVEGATFLLFGRKVENWLCYEFYSISGNGINDKFLRVRVRQNDMIINHKVKIK